MKKTFILILSLLTFMTTGIISSSCGVKGPPLPPERNAKEEVDDEDLSDEENQGNKKKTKRNE